MIAAGELGSDPAKLAAIEALKRDVTRVRSQASELRHLTELMNSEKYRADRKAMAGHRRPDVPVRLYNDDEGVMSAPGACIPTRIHLNPKKAHASGRTCPYCQFLSSTVVLTSG